MFHHVAKAFQIALQTPKLLFSSDAADYYQFLGDDVVEGQHGSFTEKDKPLWLNLGYWKTARRYVDAAEGMAHLLAQAVKLGPEDHLLDVGFGFAEQDFFWLKHYAPKKITGLNITPLHVDHANVRVKERGLQDRMDLRLGSATEIPFEPNTFDKVTALECAFHFNTREKFFDEALRVLRPGGRLALADGAQWPGTSSKLNFINRFALKRWSVPVENVYDRDEYCRRLERHGFVNVSAMSIREHVFPGCLRYKELREKGVPLSDAVIELSQKDVDDGYGLSQFALTTFTDYVIFAADKPA